MTLPPLHADRYHLVIVNHSIELVVTDLDGTLWEQPDDVPTRARDALHHVVDGPTPLLVATGRRVESTRVPLGRLGLSPPAVVLNGSLGLDLRTHERFHVGGFAPDDAVTVLDSFAALDLTPCVYVDHERPSVWVGPRPSTHADHLASFGDDVGTRDLHQIAAEHTVLAFSILGTDEDVAGAVASALDGLGTPHVAPDRLYGGTSLTVAPREASKWDGIVAFCDLHGIDPSAVLVMGDGPNDLEMLERAAVAVVPGDGHPEALQLADHVIGTAADGGWADILDLL